MQIAFEIPGLEEKAAVGTGKVVGIEKEQILVKVERASGTVAKGFLVTVHSAQGTTTFTGATDLVHPEFQVLKEARQTQDFEGTVSWGLGLSKPTCLRVFTLSDPARLVVDLQIPSS